MKPAGHRFMSLIALFLFLLAALSAAHAQNARAPRPAIDSLRATILVRTAIVTLNNANRTGNYTVLRDLAAPPFQFANSPAKLAEIFRPLRQEKVDLSPVVVLRPVFTRPPLINRQKMLVLQGYFPSRPKMVRFVLGYLPFAGRWRLNFISVNTVKAPPASATAGKAKDNVKKAAGKTPSRKNTGKKTSRKPARQKTNANAKGSRKR